jgi:hypothetical protein
MPADDSTSTLSTSSDRPGGNPALISLSRRGLWVGATLAIVLLGVYVWLVTYGTGTFAGEETWGSAFDSLAKSMVVGKADVEPDTIDWEGFQERGKIFISFGPLPALLRILPNAVLPSMHGKWSRLSCLAGSVLSLLAATLAFGTSLRRPSGGPNPAARVYLAAGVLGFGLGSPLVYLVSCSRIYHEAIIWGLCGSLWSIYFMLRILSGSISRRRGFLGMSVSFGVALLARVTFGVPLALAIGVLVVRDLLSTAREKPSGGKKITKAVELLVTLSPALVAGFFLFWYNHARFGSIWKSFDFAATYVHPEEIGGVVNLARVPSTLLNYFGLTTASVFSVPPYFQLAPVRYLDDSIFFGWKEQTLSLTLGSCWLLLGAALGLVALVRRRRVWETLIALAFLPEIAVIFTFYFVTQRYEADLLPLLVFLFSIFLTETGRRGRSAAWFAWVLVVLAGFSAVVSVASTLEWNLADNGDAPGEYKTRLARLLALEGHTPGCPGLRYALTDYAPLGQTFSYAAARLNRTWDDNPISFGHRLFARGIGMHANSRISYRVPDGAVALCAVVGVPDSSSSCRSGSVVFEVRDEADRLLASTAVVRSNDPAVPLRADLRGAKEVSLVVLDGGDGIDCDHGTWGDPVFLLALPGPLRTGGGNEQAARP